MNDSNLRPLFFLLLIVIFYFFWGSIIWFFSGRKKKIGYYFSQIRLNLFLSSLLIATLVILAQMILGLDLNDLNKITNFEW
ncbi:hypothetical protein DSECCO2_512660 [anaerobic digester metagenome]